MNNVYQGLELVGEQIRLLELEPSATFDGDLVCKLQVLDLSSPRNFSYEALSYHWGSSAKGCCININGVTHGITDSANDALRHLRHTSSRRSLWIDALCINQQDLSEKDTQIALMREVYSKARQVVVWLGHLDTGSQRAIQVMQQMAADEATHLSPGREKHVQIDGLTLASLELRAMMTAFFHIPWFRRVWTAQEILLAKEATFLCGTVFFSLATMLRYIMYTQRHWLCCLEIATADIAHGIATGSTTLYDEVMLLETMFMMQEDFDRFWKSDEQKEFDRTYKASPAFIASSEHIEDPIQSDFLSILASFRYRRASDPKDQIYGLLGFARAGIQAKLRPDYRLTVEQVFINAALAVIEESGDLKVLSHVYGVPNLDLPSWVPDWTSRLDDLLAHQARHQNLGTHRVNRSWRSRPSLIGRSTLQVEGILFDDVAEIAPAVGSVPNQEFMLRAQEMVGLAKGNMSRVFEIDGRGASATLEEAFWYAFFDDLDDDDDENIDGWDDGDEDEEEDLVAYKSEGEVDGKDEDGLVNAVHHTQAVDLDIEDIDVHGLYLPPASLPNAPTVRAWLRHFLADDFSTASVQAQRRQVNFWSHSFDRRFVRTREGRFGFAPASCREGDRIAVILGAPMVYALRTRDEESIAGSRGLTCRLLGDARLEWSDVPRSPEYGGCEIETLYLV